MKVWLLLYMLPWAARARLRSEGQQHIAVDMGGAFEATPISKVVTLLKDMQEQLEKEGEEDDEVNEKMECWCEQNEQDKSKSISDGEATVQDLTTTIESTAASSSRLSEEIDHHQQDLTKSQQSLDTATAMRQKQSAEFTAEEKDMIESIKALDSAIVVLSRHHGGAAFLDGTGAIAKVLEVARTQMKTHMHLMKGNISPRQRRLVLAFDQNQQPSGYNQAYQPQSSEIFGILKQMKETFETNLAESQKEEAENQKAYEELKAAKEQEIAATQGAIDEKSVQLADSDERNAQAKQDLQDMRVMLVNDNGFLMTVKEKCQLSAQEYETRTKLRHEEIQAVSQAISILSNDDARDSFAKTFNPAASLLQVRNSQQRGLRNAELAAALRAEAEKTHSSRLESIAALAESGNLDAFTKVKEAIDNMVTELLQEKKDEIAHRDSCIEELNQNQLLTEREERDKANHESKVEGLKTLISDLTNEITALQSEISELNTQIKRRGEDRELANKDFQQIVADHREAQQLLQKALTVMKAVYAKAVTTAAPDMAAIQVKQPTVVPPAEFKTYERSGASGGVVALIEQILADTVAMEKEVIRDEQSQQEDYEAFVKDTNLSIQSKQASIVDKTASRGKAEQDLGAAEEDVRTSITELEQLSNTAGALHMSCDFILKNFDIRQEARDQEVEALRQAKAILSGMQTE